MAVNSLGQFPDGGECDADGPDESVFSKVQKIQAVWRCSFTKLTPFGRFRQNSKSRFFLIW